MYRNSRVGELTAVYTATQYTSGLTPKVGDWFYDDVQKAKFVFLKNSGSTAITEKLACVALGTDKSNYYCALAAATAGVMGFAGVRVSGATSMAQNEYGWFQISGIATMQASSDSTTVDTAVVTSNQTAGKIEDAADTGVGAQAAFGEAVASATSADVSVAIFKNVWGI